MNKKTLYITLFSPLFCLICWCLFLTCQRQNGTDLTLPIMGYDPRDLLSGHYIQYQIDWDKVDCTQFPKSSCPKQDFCKEARWGKQCRFYIPEKDANELNQLFLSRNSNNLNFEVVYSYQSGKKAIAKQLLINEQDWKNFLGK